VGNVRTLTALALLLTACAPHDEAPGEAALAIQGGALDAHDAAVVAVALIDDGGDTLRTCSGTLVAPNLVLTAQHCVANTEPFVDCGSSVFGPPVDPGLLHVTTSASMWAGDADWLPVSAIHPPPGSRSVCGRDLALVVLASPIDARSASPIPPRLAASPFREEGYSAVGYGATEGDGDDPGLRRRRDALHVVCVGSACGSGQVTQAEWRGDHGVCNGDSGGPALDRQGFVIGVTSRGPSGCESPIYGGLLDHAPWIRDVAQEAARAAALAVPPWAEGEP
jgi:Trypsin